MAVLGGNPNPENIVDETFVDEEVGAVYWDQLLRVMDCKVDCGPYAGCGGSHGGAEELEEILVSPLKDIILHYQDHSVLDCSKWITRRLAVFETVEPGCDNQDGVICVYIGIHGVGVGGK